MSRTGGAATLDGSPLRGLPVAEQTLPALLERQATRYGDKPLFRMGGVERSFAGTRDAAALAAGTLHAAGIRRGDRLALMCENRIELLDMILGATWMGAVAVPLNTALRGEQLAHQLRNSGARVLAMDSALVEVLAHAEGIDALEQVWALDGVPAELPHGLRAAVRDVPPAAAAVPAAPVGPGTPARSSTRRARRGRRRASNARTRSSTGGASSSARCSGSARTTSCTPSCRSSTRTP